MTRRDVRTSSSATRLDLGHLRSPPCPHKAPMALAPLVIRWGPDTSGDMLRQCARCTYVRQANRVRMGEDAMAKWEAMDERDGKVAVLDQRRKLAGAGA